MSPIKNRAGQRYGRLMAICPTELRSASGEIVWKCVCDCENVIYVSGGNLQNGNTQSCGCLGKESRHKNGLKAGPENGKRNIKDLTGRVFGRLLVLRRSKYRPQTTYRNINWLCRCSCNRYTIVSSGDLRNKSTQSCGCLNRENHTTHGMSNTKEYDSWLATKRLEQKRELDFEWTLEMKLALKKLFPTCVVCGSVKILGEDHVLPLSKGNGLKPGNAVILCQSCNSKKNARSLDKLPEDMAIKIIHAAEHFRCYWGFQHETM